ncbi:MAG: hypothetical protein IPN06_16240 [Burkholderiales bacterium]|nr:hypothetical protein [Burkholderiales bacterium]
MVVRELWVHSGPFRRRCDLVGFVNGLPLVFIELKRHDKGLKAAFDDNCTDYKRHDSALVPLQRAGDRFQRPDARLVLSPALGSLFTAGSALTRTTGPRTKAR